MKILPSFFFIVCLGLIIAGAFISKGVNQAKKSDLPVISLAQTFSLNDLNSGFLNADTLHGKVWLANFFFTTCQGICPTIMAEVSKVNKALSSFDNYNLISISIDPKNDSLPRLKEYSNKHNADQNKWKFLFGNMNIINPLLENGFKVNAVLDEAPQSHSTRLVLVDQDFQIRAYYDGLQPNISKKIIEDMQGLLEEVY